jgi:hypothetical protein
MSFKACITSSQRYSSSFFLSNLSFWILRQNLGPSLHNPEKTAEKSEFRKILDEPILQNPEKSRKNPRFKIFLGPLKIAGNHGKSKFRNLFIAGKPRRILDEPVLQNLETKRKNPSFEIFLGPLKIARNCGKIQILEARFSQKFA